MNSRPLDGLKIIDLSTRLPGPLSTKILRDLGANVIKIEDVHYGDSFNPTLAAWYRALNSDKNIVKLNFNDSTIKDQILTYTHDCDGIILGINEKLQRILGVHPEELQTQNICCILEIKSQGHSNHGMHDLNIMAETHLLNLYLHNKTQPIEAPPFLPMAGINFGQTIATQFLAHYLRAQKTAKNSHTICFLDDSIKNSLAIFFDLSNPHYKSLHNGLFPCYNLYRTKDHNYVALAAVEEKYWKRFLMLFGLPDCLDRFNTDETQVFSILKNLFGQQTLAEINALIKNQDLCLSPIKLS